MHRGGGFTKDYLYLTGLKKVYDYFKSEEDLKHLLIGKTTVEYKNEIKYLLKLNLAIKSSYIPNSFFKSINNRNETISFILKKIK